ncbi:MFS transporter (plasmid) [Legionella lytica]|uniref:MFS transporter n=1 Tax=Legionella lytica TaxID=96232 RepID=A0ABY4YD22_9GAMM|nr:MFS transporter [Legionella lytica]USQ15394.1 MFS transporter [Legionella lytica]
MTVKGLVIWLICALFFLYEFFLRTVLGIFQVPLMNELNLSAVQFAMISSTAYQVIYGLMQIPVGIIADRFQLKRTLLCATLICTLATLGFAFSSGYTSALFYRFLMGLGSSFGFVCLLLAVYDWLPRKNIAFFIGLSQFIGTIGPMLAAGPLNSLLAGHSHNWRSLFLILAGIGAGLACLVLYFVEQNRGREGDFFILSRPSTLRSNVQLLLRQKQVWYIGFYSALVYFTLEYLSENEGISFLVHKGYSHIFSAYLISISWLGYAIGCPFLGYLSDKAQQRKPIMVFSISCVLLSFSAILYLPLSQTALIGCFLMLGLGASGQSIGFAIISEYCQARYLTIGLAFNNSLIMFYSASSAPFIGYLLESKSDYVNPIVHYQKCFSVLIVLVSLGFLLSLGFIKETFCKQVNENTLLK